MFKVIRNSLICLAVLAMALPAWAAPKELIVSSVMMETHPVMANFTLPLLREWEKMSNNAIKVTYFNPGTICAAIDMIPSTEKGVLSITVSPLGAVPAMFPAATITNLPLIFTNSRSAALTMSEAFQTLPQLQKEMSNWRFIFAGGSIPTNLLTTKKPVHTMEDIKGLKIGVTSNDSMEVVKSLGGTPVVFQLNDMYLAMQRGMVDGCLLPQPTFRSTKVTEVGKYLTICNMQCSPTPLMMSKATYESLPAEATKVLEDIGLQAMSAAAGCFPDYFGIEDTNWIVENHKVQVYVLPEEERQRWITAVEPVQQLWVERAKRQGVEDPAGLLAAFKAIADKYNDPVVQKEMLDGYKDILGGFFPPEKIYSTLWP